MLTLLLFIAALPGKVHCEATNYPTVVASKGPDGKMHEQEYDDFRVTCTVTVAGKKIFEQALPLAHPTSFSEAMSAIDHFRKYEAPIIQKQKEVTP